MGKSLNKSAGRFILRERPLGHDGGRLSETQKELWKVLGDGPVALTDLFARFDMLEYIRHPLDDLIEHGLVAVGAFTPTDAVHVLGRYCSGSVEAAGLGAEIWGKRLDMDKIDFCERVVKRVQIQAEHTLIGSALAEEGESPRDDPNSVERLLIDRALEAEENATFDVSFALRRPIIGIGAPALTYMTPLAEKLQTELIVPEHAEVANAVGAVAGGIVQHVRVLIRPSRGGETFRVYAPSGVHDFEELEKAAAFARRIATNLVRRLAHQAGASRAKINVERIDRNVPIIGQIMYLETEIIVTAVGRPRPLL